MRQRGKRSSTTLHREKRERLKEKRTNRYKRCNRVNSREIDRKWVQDRNQKMVIIGSDAISLYPT